MQIKNYFTLILMFSILRLNIIYIVLCLPFTEDRKIDKTVQKLFQENVAHWSYIT